MMKYFVTVNRRYHYVKVFSVLKRINEKTNPVSRAFASLVERLVSNNKKSKG